MPKLKRLSVKEVVRILERFGFEIYSQKGSHIKLQRLTAEGDRQRIVVAGHGSKTIKPGTLKGIYRRALTFVDEDELRPHFYAD